MLSKKVTRARLREMAATMPPCVVAMEACGSAHYWGRRFRQYDHDVKLIAPQFVKPFVKSNKNDALDAEAICEAVQRPGMRFVAIKTIEQQDIQAQHRVREVAVQSRTAHVNQIRGLRLEYGIEIPKGREAVGKQLPEILEDADNGLSPAFRALPCRLREALRRLDEQVAQANRDIAALAAADERVQRLRSIPGVGPLVSTALVAAVGDVNTFKNGRALAAWLGLVPR